MYSVVILLSLIGNVAVLFVVARNKRMHTPTNYFIVNLAISDIMVTSSCTWVHLVDNLTEGWVLGAFFCKLNSFSQGTLPPGPASLSLVDSLDSVVIHISETRLYLFI